MTQKGWTQIKKEAADRHVSVAKYVMALGRSEWSRVSNNARVPWLKVGTRPDLLGLALDVETLLNYDQIARDLFAVSANGSRDMVGIVLQLYADGKAAPGKVDVTPQAVGHKDAYELSLSHEAREGLKRRLECKQITKGLDQLAERRPKLHLLKLSPADARRFPYRLRIKPDTVKFFAEQGLKLGLKPQVRHGLISWASLCIEMLGLGQIVPEMQIQDERLEVAAS